MNYREGTYIPQYLCWTPCRSPVFETEACVLFAAYSVLLSFLQGTLLPASFNKQAINAVLKYVSHLGLCYFPSPALKPVLYTELFERLDIQSSLFPIDAARQSDACGTGELLFPCNIII